MNLTEFDFAKTRCAIILQQFYVYDLFYLSELSENKNKKSNRNWLLFSLLLLDINQFMFAVMFQWQFTDPLYEVQTVLIQIVVYIPYPLLWQ